MLCAFSHISSFGDARLIRYESCATTNPISLASTRARKLSAASSAIGFAFHWFAFLVKIWQAETGEVLLTLQDHEGEVLGVAFSPDGSRLASSGADRNVKVWEFQNGREALTFKGHADAVTCVCFSPDGARVASAGYDKTVRVW